MCPLYWEPDKTTKTILTHYKIDQKLDNPFIEYARYVLADGTDSERTFLASNMGPMLQIKDGELEYYESSLYL
jgi:hypothetical protein